jgi:hypothetical protein
VSARIATISSIALTVAAVAVGYAIAVTHPDRFGRIAGSPGFQGHHVIAHLGQGLDTL